MADGSRPPCSGHRIDFTEINERSPREVIEEARAVCASCPMLLGCLAYLEEVEVAGLAGGMLESQRALWRHQQGATPDKTTWIDALEVEEVSQELVDDLPLPPRGLDEKRVELVERMTNAGLTALEIAERTGLAQSTINYIRREKIATGITAQRKVANKRRNPRVVDHAVMLEWAHSQGIEAELNAAGKLPYRVVALYHAAHGTGRDSGRRRARCDG